MRATFTLDMPISFGSGEALKEALLLEAVSTPEGGSIGIRRMGDNDHEHLVIDLSSGDLSTARAMLNSYLGLASVAARSLEGF